MRARRTLVALGATVMALTITAPAMAGATPPFFDVGKLPEPPVSGKEMADNLDAFSTTYTARYTGTPNEQSAATMLVDELKGLGFEADIVLQPQAGEPFTLVKAVIARRKGTTHPDEEIVFTTHYDGFPRTVNAAYDNGSGVQMLRALAKSISQIPTNRTFTFAFYNGEEEGALGSKPMAQQYADEKRVVRALLGFDMVGIAWPVKTPVDTSCLCMWRGEDDDVFDALQSHVAFDVLGFPNQENLVEVRGLNDRNSDEDSWDLVGYPTMRWAGLKKAADYPEYHTQDDSMATIDAVAGDRSFFEQGMRNTLLTAYYTALSMDNDMPAAKATVTGTGPTVSFDAAGSSDPDAAPGGYTWRFGDGATATGASVTHSYEKAGDYVATLEVADNLWAPVTASAVVPVKVTQGAAAPAVKKKLSKRARCLKKAKRIKNKRKRAKAIKRCKKRFKKH